MPATLSSRLFPQLAPKLDEAGTRAEQSRAPPPLPRPGAEEFRRL